MVSSSSPYICLVLWCVATPAIQAELLVELWKQYDLNAAEHPRVREEKGGKNTPGCGRDQKSLF